MSSAGRTRIAFVITGLTTGGAEMMLLKLLSRLDRKEFEPAVFSLTTVHPLGEHFREIGVPVQGIGMPRGVPDPRGIIRLAWRLRKFRPQIVQTWMYHADLIGGLAARLAGSAPVIWNIRHSDLNPRTDKRSTILTARLCAFLSRSLPQRIICCAEAAQRIHILFGYEQGKFVVIPNGFDLAAFRPNRKARTDVRRELGLPADAIVIGLAARFHPQKDHGSFIRAAAACVAASEQTRFVLCGDGISLDNAELAGLIRKTGAADRFFLLGRRTDMPEITSAFDIGCSSSVSGEGFSNVLGEAMACGIPCVATDVGDAAQVVGGTGRIVPPNDSSALAAALLEVIQLPEEERMALGKRARQRVVENFSIEQVTARYESLYRSIPGKVPGSVTALTER